jgi:hypothetical protein
MATIKKSPSNPALYQQLSESAWMWTPPGAHRKHYGKHLLSLTSIGKACHPLTMINPMHCHAMQTHTILLDMDPTMFARPQHVRKWNALMKIWN